MGIDFPAKLQCLFQPKRYKIAYGGRGSAKSWSFARALLLLGAQRKERILCVREQQNSIADSVHALLADQIRALGLGEFYQVKQQEIVGANGTTFAFEGIRHNVNRIKSYEGITRCWAEEAQKISAGSWSVLRPTIRVEDEEFTSEIWITFNPDLESDPTFTQFVRRPPRDSFVVEMNWRDNPWFPKVLREEMEECKLRDKDEYLNVWEGKCRVLLEGAVFAEEMRAAIGEGRICRVPPQGGFPVDFFFDLGWSDKTAVWARQRVAFEWRYVDYYENSGRKLDHYLEWIAATKLLVGTIWLPHDAKAKSLGTGQSIEERVRRVYPGKVRIVRNLSVEDRIDSARTIFGNCWFDEDNCADGLKCLKGWRYGVGEDGRSKYPIHDAFSHGADAFTYSGVSVKQPRTERIEAREAKLAKRPGAALGELSLGVGWMR